MTYRLKGDDRRSTMTKAEFEAFEQKKAEIEAWNRYVWEVFELRRKEREDAWRAGYSDPGVRPWIGLVAHIDDELRRAVIIESAGD